MYYDCAKGHQLIDCLPIEFQNLLEVKIDFPSITEATHLSVSSLHYELLKQI